MKVTLRNTSNSVFQFYIGTEEVEFFDVKQIMYKPLKMEGKQMHILSLHRRISPSVE